MAPENCEGLQESTVAYCDRPPAGWWCSLQAGHHGPCPTRPVVHVTDAHDLREAATVLAQVVRAHKINASTRKNDELTEHQKDCYAAALLVLDLPPDYLGPEFDRGPSVERCDICDGQHDWTGHDG